MHEGLQALNEFGEHSKANLIWIPRRSDNKGNERAAHFADRQAEPFRGIPGRHIKRLVWSCSEKKSANCQLSAGQRSAKNL